MSEFVDTNIFIRLITGDDRAKMVRCLDLFKRVECGDAHLIISEAIVAEVIYVLSSPATYRLGREDITQRFRPLLELKGIQLDHKHAVLRALDLYEQTRLDFEDCLAIEHVRRLDLNGVYSYDRGLGRIADVRRLEP